jgi:glycosyltransferase involved in cell wall biosynthesis
VLYVHPSDELYGSDRCLLELVRARPAGQRAIVALPRDLIYGGALSNALRACGAEVLHLDMLAMRRSLLRPGHLPLLAKRLVGGSWSLSRLIRREQVELVHSNTVAVVCGAVAARCTGTPHLWHVHEFLGDEPLPYRATLRALLGLPRGLIIANSVAVARSATGSSRRLRARTRVIYNGIFTVIQPRPFTGSPPNRPARIGVLGRLTPRKGISEALQATAHLTERGRSVELWLAGGAAPGQEWRLRQYAAQADDLGVAGQVHWLGECSEPGEFLAQIDILLVPSQRPEPFGLVILEGLAAGLPVVVTRNGGGSGEIITHGKDGLYCGMQPAAIAATLDALLGDTHLWGRLASAAPVTVARRFTRDGYVAAFRRAQTRALTAAMRGSTPKGCTLWRWVRAAIG